MLFLLCDCFVKGCLDLKLMGNSISNCLLETVQRVQIIQALTDRAHRLPWKPAKIGPARERALLSGLLTALPINIGAALKGYRLGTG